MKTMNSVPSPMAWIPHFASFEVQVLEKLHTHSRRPSSMRVAGGTGLPGSDVEEKLKKVGSLLGAVLAIIPSVKGNSWAWIWSFVWENSSGAALPQPSRNWPQLLTLYCDTLCALSTTPSSSCKQTGLRLPFRKLCCLELQKMDGQTALSLQNCWIEYASGLSSHWKNLKGHYLWFLQLVSEKRPLSRSMFWSTKLLNPCTRLGLV